MNSKETAKELYLKFYIPDYCFAKAGMPADWKQRASKKNAIMVVDELLNHCYEVMKPFWEEVKLEIEKL